MDIITYALCRKNGGGGGGGDNTHFIGTTTTAITDGATTNPITVDGESYTAVKGDIVIYNSTEFIFDGSAWQSFGGTMDTQPTQDSAKAVTSDGVYRYTAGQREYVNNTLKGEIFNTYSGNAKNVASGDSSHAEGLSTTASGIGSHAEGGHTVASNDGSHAEGASTVASGQYSHAEGVRAEAIGFASHASGIHTIANTNASTVVGRYNVLDGTSENDPKHLLIVGNGTAFDSRSNIVEVSDTYLNVNGDIKKNGIALGSLAMKDADDIHREISDVEYEALPAAKKNNGTEYFVYETGDDNRSIVCKDANGNFKYRAFVYGVADNNSGTGWNKSATDSDAPTTPPTKVNPQLSGTSLIWGLETSEKTVYFNRFSGNAPNGSNASDKDASNIGFMLTGNVNNQYSLTKNGTAWITANFVTLSTGDTIELAITPKPNGFKRIYKGDELYATNELPDITPHVELTQSQYDALQNPDPNTEYFITNGDAGGNFSSIEDRMTAIEDEYTSVYMDGNVRIPLYTRNVYKVVRVDGNTVEWYIAEPTSQRNFKATVTATGSAGTRTNPTVTVTEIV